MSEAHDPATWSRSSLITLQCKNVPHGAKLPSFPAGGSHYSAEKRICYGKLLKRSKIPCWYIPMTVSCTHHAACAAWLCLGSHHGSPRGFVRVIAAPCSDLAVCCTNLRCSASLVGDHELLSGTLQDSWRCGKPSRVCAADCVTQGDVGDQVLVIQPHACITEMSQARTSAEPGPG